MLDESTDICRLWLKIVNPANKTVKTGFVGPGMNDSTMRQFLFHFVCPVSEFVNQTFPQKNRKRRNRKKKSKKKRAQEKKEQAEQQQKESSDKEKDKEKEQEVEIEYVTDEPEIYDPNYIFFKRIFEAFKVTTADIVE